MQAVSEQLLGRFARAFCFRRNGYSLRDLTDLFIRYDANAPTTPVGVGLSKADYFVHCVGGMNPRTQRGFLYDLCDGPPPATGKLPSVEDRLSLLHALVQADGISPLGVELSSMTLAGVREQWFTAASRVASSPSSAVTAARTMVEAACNTILEERGQPPDTSGQVSRLFKQTLRALGLEKSEQWPTALHTAIGGLEQVVRGLAEFSNKAGDRHGLPEGLRLDDEALAGLAVHAAGAITLFVATEHRHSMRTRAGNDVSP